jgi:hypothetical protein
MAALAFELDDFPWGTLLQHIRDKQCTPFVGAGACAGILPLAAELATQLIEDDERSSGRRCPLPNRQDLAKVCQYLAVTRKNGRWPKMRIIERLSTYSRPDFENRNQIHRVLADLKLPVYLTTNYDDLLGLAVERNTPNVTRDFARWSKGLRSNSSPFDTGYQPTPQHPVIFHLHGMLGQPASMVATEDDYVDFLVNLSRDLANPPTQAGQKSVLPLPIHTALVSNMLLFVGYSLSDVNFRVILRGLIGSLDVSEIVDGIAIQYSAGDPDEFLKYVADYFQRSLKMQVFWSTAERFAEELRKRL